MILVAAVWYGLTVRDAHARVLTFGDTKSAHGWQCSRCVSRNANGVAVNAIAQQTKIIKHSAIKALSCSVRTYADGKAIRIGPLRNAERALDGPFFSSQAVPRVGLTT
jgi:hypothetical protein